MKSRTRIIDTYQADHSKYSERPMKTSWQMQALKKGLQVVQHVSPALSSRVIWHQFTKPGKPKFTEPQRAIMARAQTQEMNYHGYKVTSYRWGTSGPKVLLAHGWRSKTADFRRMIEALLAQGYVVEGIDMKAHGASEGKHSALPEFRDMLKAHYVKNAPYQAVVGYSMGGAATAIMLSELSPTLYPEQVFLIATPPFAKHYFKTAVDFAGCNDRTYMQLCNLVQKEYNQPIAYFDLTERASDLSVTNIHFVYDENDSVVPFNQGQKLRSHFPDSYLLHTKGVGHYRIIAQQEVIDYVMEEMASLPK